MLSGRQIKELVHSNKLIISPFDESLVQPASYDLRMGSRILASPLGVEKLGMVIDLTPVKNNYQIQSGQMVGVLSYEKLGIPLDISGRFGIRSYFARLGIIAFGGLQLDPGFRGRLTMNLLNVGPEPITIKLHEPLFTVEFQKLEEPAEMEYSGPYQGQEDFPDDQYNFIISARTTSLAEIPTLREEVARLNILIEQFEDWLPDPDEGLEIKPEIKGRLLNLSKTPGEQLLTIQEFKKRLKV